MRLGLTTMIPNPHSGLDPLSPIREDESLSYGRLRVFARNEVKKREDSPIVSCLAVPRQIRALWNIGKIEPGY